MLQARFATRAAPAEAKLALVAVAPRRRRPAEQRRISVTQKPLLVVAGGYRDDAGARVRGGLGLATGRGAIAPLPFATCYAAAAVVDGRFTSPAARAPATVGSRCGTRRRASGAPRTSRIAQSAAPRRRGPALLIGGLLDLGETASVIRYCPTSDAWQWGEDARDPVAPEAAVGRHGGALATARLVGGGSPLVCRRDGDGYRAWEDVADLPTGWVRWPGAATVEL
ncbi:hypothetical protein JL722_13309 [Aureococcus anophagefferens]|nr:hypothetical protein JL722_13309 [Aureococcus anophagefferens]